MKTFDYVLDCSHGEEDDDPVFYQKFIENVVRLHKDVLNKRGYVFVRDILEDLEFPVRKEILGYGWTKGDEIIYKTEIKKSNVLFSLKAKSIMKSKVFENWKGETHYV